MTHTVKRIALENLAEWSKEYQDDKVGQLAGSVFQHGNIDELLINRKHEIADKQIFNTKIEPEGAPVTDQKSSGRCWLFASTNLLRLRLMNKYNLKECRLSPSYLFFYDKLEKSNFFLEQIIDTAKEDVNSRLVQWFLSDPISDGGQFTMMTQIVDKYGLVPNDIYPDSFNTTLSRVMDRLITSKLREYAQVLREKIAKGESIDGEKLRMQHSIYRLLCIFLGEPPKPDDEFVWEYYDKENKFHSLQTTPKKFVTENIDFQTPEYVSLLNDPRNSYNRVVKIDRLGNVTGGQTVSYLNMDIDVLSQAVVNRIKNNQAVFFGTDTPKFMDKKRGIMDVDLWDYKLIGYDQRSVDKASRVIYHNSLMTHAMLITAVHLDENGKPVRYRVENSWSSKSGSEGYYVMTQDYFKEYVYQVVVEKKDIPEYVSLLEDKEPVVLPPYDPMGALAMN
ncbi:hypothetical protein FOA43_004609 [Brettanomyces nanus]|uniref:Cysteine proteinase 1, mitochondrial n=1 Tax=Eeniella nana TaxID=13502 RepID=A0A875SBX2_EENNA|nr:uncharacterized protein FOA43_004609 [Brettanomyces nanus]QPG77202.1 hypothetical protein FOA43_004609 [Brettanomyces nanus]